MSADVAIRRTRHGSAAEDNQRLRRLRALQDNRDEILAQGPLQVRRREIRWYTAGDRVAIAVTVRNLGDRPSAPTRAMIQAAALGAFVPWRPLTAVEVPELEPGESAVLRAEARRPAPRPLGPPDRLHPARLLTALDVDDERPGAGLATPLPASPFDFLFGKTTYWAGNLNVFLGNQAVERHRAEALRILPGHVNLAMFCVGGGPGDAYRFELLGLERGWQALLLDPSRASTVVNLIDSGPITLGEWIPGPRCRFLILALSPPSNCEQDEVEVHVTQQSTGKSAVVEFSFSPDAAGPGCYVVG
jgi:hypothetical protein